MATLVVRGDCNVDKFSGRIRIAESDDRNVDVRCFFDRLGICARVGDDDQTRLFERARDVIGEIAWREATSNGDGTSVGGELEHSALTIGTGRDDGNVCGIIDGCDDAGSKDDFLPRSQVRRAKLSDCCATSNQVLPIFITLIPSGRVFHR